MKVEIRSNDCAVISGYVNAVERRSRVISRPGAPPFREIVRPGTFRKALESGEKVELMLNHERTLCDTTSGLELREDGDRHFIRGEYRPVDSYEGGELLLSENEPLPNGNETLPDGSAPVDKRELGGIIEERVYDPTQKRDEHGRWTSGGGSKGKASKRRKSSAKSTAPMMSRKEQNDVSHGIATDHPKLKADGVKHIYEYGNYRYGFYVNGFGSYRFTSKKRLR